MRRVLVTGGCGFIGSTFIRLLLAEEPDAEVTNLDLLTYAGNPRNLEDLPGSSRYRFVHGDVRDETVVEGLVRQADWIVNFAAESHVDRSIDSPGDFIRTNVLGAYELLEAAREHWGALRGEKQAGFRFLHVSTDEVFGTLGSLGHFSEATPYSPQSRGSSR